MHKSGLRKEAKWQRAEAGIYSLDYYLKDFGLSLKTEMEKRADGADASVLFFLLGCANFWAVYALIR